MFRAAAWRTAAWQTAAWRATTGLVLALCLTACSDSGPGRAVSADTDLAGTAAADSINSSSSDSHTGGAVTWAISAPIDNWNLFTRSGDTFDAHQVLGAVYPSAFTVNPSYTVTLNSDLLDSANQTSTSPQTIVYRIKSSAAWSDGTPITVDDFDYAWRAQSADPAAVSTIGYSRIASITGSDHGKTVTVVFAKPFADWKSLFSTLYPAHIAKQHGDIAAASAWFAANAPTISGGPFSLAALSADHTSVTLDRNTHYYGPAAQLDKVVFRVVTGPAQQAAALRDGTVDGIYPQPQSGLIDTIKTMGAAVAYHIDSGLEVEHIDFNLKNATLGGKPWSNTLRTAMFTAFDRDDVLAKTIQRIQPTAVPLDNRMLVRNQAGYQDNLTKHGLGTGDAARARKSLTAAGFTNAALGGRLTAPDGTVIPALSLKYPMGNQIRQAESELFAADAARLGITVNVSPTDNLGATLAQSGGAYRYDLIVYSSTASAFPSAADQAAYTTGGAGNFGGYSNARVDRWLNDAVLSEDQGASSQSAVTDYLNKADDQISQDAYSLPIFQWPALIAFSPKLGNVRDNVTELGPTYNLRQWTWVRPT